jgi:outer membrane biosynthesis protein TonB
MRKLKMTKRLPVAVILSVILLFGMYSCGSESDTNTDSETEVIIETTVPETEVEVETTKTSKTRVIRSSRKQENIEVNSEAEDVELEVDFGDVGYTNTYNYMDVDEPPMFDECEDKVTKEEMQECFEKFLLKNLHENIIYPESAKDLDIEGRTYVGFVVDNTGMISQVKILKGSGADYEKTEKAINNIIDAYDDLDNAAVIAINATPKTQPATVDGKPVNVQYVIPVVFEIQ